MKVCFKLIAVFVIFTSGCNGTFLEKIRAIKEHLWPDILESPTKLTCSADGICKVGMVFLFVNYSDVSNNCAAKPYYFFTTFIPTRLIRYYITVNKKTCR